VQIEPEYRTKIRTYVTEHNVRGARGLSSVRRHRATWSSGGPADRGPSLTKYRYVYSGQRVILVDPPTRNVAQEVD
jgi:hypothetical protein